MDASEVGVAAVLLQVNAKDQRLHPCAFFSRCLTPAEQNYEMGNRELLALELALQDWRHWQEGAAMSFAEIWSEKTELTASSVGAVFGKV